MAETVFLRNENKCIINILDKKNLYKNSLISANYDFLQSNQRLLLVLNHFFKEKTVKNVIFHYEKL